MSIKKEKKKTVAPAQTYSEAFKRQVVSKLVQLFWLGNGNFAWENQTPSCIKKATIKIVAFKIQNKNFIL